MTGPVRNSGWLRFDGTRLPEQHAACLVALGRFDHAETELTAALQRPTTPRRTAAIRCDQARIALHQHDFDAAEHYLTAAARLASCNGSSYITAKLGDLAPAIRDADDGSPQAHALTDLLASTMTQT